MRAAIGDDGVVAERRRRGGPRDLLLSMLVLAVVLIGIVAFSQAGSKPTQKVIAVDYTVSLDSLRRTAPFPVYAPQPAPAGWIANHAIAHEPAPADDSYSWDLGFYVPASDQYAAVEQSSASTWLDTQLGQARKQGATALVAGQQWQTWTDSGGRPALVRAVAGSTLVVDGRASLATLERLAATLAT